MTLNQLTEQVLTLGFEATLEDEEAFICSTNRALEQIFSELGYEGVLRTVCNPQTPCFSMAEYDHAPAEAHTLTLRGRAVCFKVSGEGSFVLKSGGKSYEQTFSTPYGVFRKFITDGATLTFNGQFGYKVLDITCYDDIRSADEKDIPVPSLTTTIDAALLAPDIVSISDMPKDRWGKTIRGASVKGCKITLPSDFSGELSIRYKRKPTPVYSDSTGSIDIPEESAWLLPLLVSSYLWLDDDGGKAQYYMQLYREGVLRLQASIPRRIDPSYNDVLRWC